MKLFKYMFISMAISLTMVVFADSIALADPSAPAPPDCKGTGALALPTWYAYVPMNADCTVQDDLGGMLVVYILMGLFDLVLFLGGFIAVIMVIFGGFKLLTSTGEPQKIAAARTTILHALIGLGITILASQVVGFIAGRLT